MGVIAHCQHSAGLAPIVCRQNDHLASLKVTSNPLAIVFFKAAYHKQRDHGVGTE